jgi:hypothetical protein
MELLLCVELDEGNVVPPAELELDTTGVTEELLCFELDEDE